MQITGGESNITATQNNNQKFKNTQDNDIVTEVVGDNNNVTSTQDNSIKNLGGPQSNDVNINDRGDAKSKVQSFINKTKGTEKGYGQGLSAPPGSGFSRQFIDKDGDGTDDRFQSGPGMPKEKVGSQYKAGPEPATPQPPKDNVPNAINLMKDGQDRDAWNMLRRTVGLGDGTDEQWNSELAKRQKNSELAKSLGGGPQPPTPKSALDMKVGYEPWLMPGNKPSSSGTDLGSGNRNISSSQSSKQDYNNNMDNDIVAEIKGNNNFAKFYQDNSIRNYGGDQRSFTYVGGKKPLLDTPVSAATMSGFYDPDFSPSGQAKFVDMYTTMNNDNQKRRKALTPSIAEEMIRRAGTLPGFDHRVLDKANRMSEQISRDRVTNMSLNLYGDTFKAGVPNWNSPERQGGVEQPDYDDLFKKYTSF